MKDTALLAILPLILFVPLHAESAIVEDNCPGDRTTIRSGKFLSRKKRYLAFPTGTNFVTTITLLKAIQIKEPSNWNLDFEFDMIWPIPNEEKLYRKPVKRFKPYHRTRRHKRDLYANIEVALTSQGLPGSACILRTICEARVYLSPPGVSFLQDILRIILSQEHPRPNALDKYDDAYRTKKDCDMKYPCPISILDFLLNYHEHDDYDEP